MTLLTNPNNRAGIATVQDLTVLVVANLSKFLIIWILTLAAFVTYAFLQPLKYHYSAVVKIPEISVKGLPRQLVSGAELVEYLTNVALPSLQISSDQKPLLKQLRFTSMPNSNLVVLSADVLEDQKVTVLLNNLAQDALRYCRSGEELAKNTQTNMQISVSPAQIVASAQRGQNPINLGRGVIILLGLIFATLGGIMSVVLNVFSHNVCNDVRRLKAENAAAEV